MTRTAHSPVEHHLAKLSPQWWEVGDYRIALEVSGKADPADLGLCDLSILPKFGIKGPGAVAWVREQGINVPDVTCGASPIEGGGWVVRSGGDEVFIEGTLQGEPVSRLVAALKENTPPHCYRIERQEATFLTLGARVHDALLQTCGVDLAKEPTDRAIYTRVAGVSAAIVVEEQFGHRAYRLWVDYTYASYLWEQLAEIMNELGGGVVGTGVMYPDLTA